MTDTGSIPNTSAPNDLTVGGAAGSAFMLAPRSVPLGFFERGPNPVEWLPQIDGGGEGREPRFEFRGPRGIGRMRTHHRGPQQETPRGSRIGRLHECHGQAGVGPDVEHRFKVGEHHHGLGLALGQQRTADLPAVEMAVERGTVENLLGTRHLDRCRAVEFEGATKAIHHEVAAELASNGGLAGFWTFPIESVSQSEGGFESVHQSVVVMPHWIVTPDAQGCWQVVMQITAGSLATELATATGHKLRTGA